MKVKITFILVFSSLFFGFKVAHAGVIINEVQISPTENRFIELYNSGNATVDLTNWYIQRKTQNGNDFMSLVSKTNFENKKIDSNRYFLISRNEINNPDIVIGSLTLTESNTIQIKNSSQEIVDKISWGDINDCNGICISNPTEGESLQRVNNDWIVATPTPGIVNKNNSITDISNIDNENISSTTEQKTKSKIIEIPTMKAKILAGNTAFTGQPFKLKSNIFGLLNEKVVLGKVYWNFGDGSFFEQINNFEEFSHTYYYPGEYSLILEYYSNNFSKIPDITTQMTIKVIPTTVVISKVGNYEDFFIELTNGAMSDIDISNWVIEANKKFFTLPRNTIILSKKQITLSSKVTNFKFIDQYSLKLFSSSGELIYDYGVRSIPTVNNYYGGKQIQAENKSKSTNETKKLSALVLPSNIKDSSLALTASPILNDISQNSNSQKIYPILGFVIILVLSSGLVYYVRKNSSKTRDDFEILDE